VLVNVGERSNVKQSADLVITVLVHIDTIEALQYIISLTFSSKFNSFTTPPKCFQIFFKYAASASAYTRLYCVSVSPADSTITVLKLEYLPSDVDLKAFDNVGLRLTECLTRKRYLEAGNKTLR
jgi:hypothetical protein